MKMILVVIAILGVISCASAAPKCYWSYCAGILIPGAVTCRDQFGPEAKYHGDTWKGDCKWDSEQVECCIPSNRTHAACKWTTNCYGEDYQGNDACYKDFDTSYIASGQTTDISCPEDLTKRYYCCPY